MSTIKRATAVMAALAILAGCTAPDQPLLDLAEAHCHAEPSDPHCADYLPALRTMIEHEKQEQANKVIGTIALGVLAVGLIAAGAAVGGPPPPPHFAPPPLPPRW